MATSIHSQYVAFSAAEFDADEPVDTAMARSLVNNSLHIADSCGQVLVAYAATGSNSLVPTVVDADEFYHVQTWGPFSLKTRSDGTAYPIRVRVAGYNSQSGGTTTIRVAVCPWGDRRVQIARNGDNVLEATSSSTTSAWLAPGTTLLSIDAALVGSADATFSTLDGVGGSRVGVHFTEMCVTVWAATDTVGKDPALSGLYAAEYIGT